MCRLDCSLLDAEEDAGCCLEELAADGPATEEAEGGAVPDLDDCIRGLSMVRDLEGRRDLVNYKNYISRENILEFC
jgi:hypothetical protein